jgi:hypothetical protein
MAAATSAENSFFATTSIAERVFSVYLSLRAHVSSNRKDDEIFIVLKMNPCLAGESLLVDFPS